jgi:carboxypeptidase family protein/TonB-dependent receptor-like protein
MPQREMWNIKRFYAAAICALILIVAVGVSRTEAQVRTATISGTVEDNSGAVLVGAKIEVKNLGTGITQSVITDAQGRYGMPDLPVGSYEVRASATGFQTVVRTGITLTVGSQPVADFTLPTGPTSETVTVIGEAAQVDTRTATVSSLVTPTQMRELPLNGRNFSALLTLAPGVQTVPQSPAGGGGSATFYGQGTNYSVSGSRPVGQSFLLDNTELQGFFNHGAGSSVTGNSLGVEAIEEFRVLTNTYSAEFGGTGAVVNAVSRSGKNTLHGSAFEFLRNSVFDAKNYFDNPAADIPSFRRNQFGGSLGGPIDKDKLFFFGAYEGLRQGQGQTGRQFVPSAGARQGILPCAALNNTANCTASTPDVNLGVPNPNDPNPDKARVAQILKLYPLPNASPSPGLPVGSELIDSLGRRTGIGLFTSVSSEIINEDYVLGRMDYTFSQKDSLFGRYIFDRAFRRIPFPLANIDKWPEVDNTFNQFFTIEERRIFSPKLVNSIRFSFTRTNERARTDGSAPTLQIIGAGRQDAAINATGPGGPVTPIGANGATPFFLVQNKFTVGDDLFLNSGSHSLKVGATVTRVQTNLSAPAFVGGTFTFGTLENFLNGTPTNMLGSAAPSPGFSTARYFREIDFFPYIQDDWKLTPRLTLNLGLRYAFATNAVGAGGTPLNVILDPLTSTGFIQVEHVLASNPNVWNLDPRIGLAWDPFKDHRTSIRAGFGIFHEPVAPRTYAPAYYLAPPSGSTILVNLRLATGNPALPPLLLSNPYGIGLPPGSVFAANFTAFAGLDYQTDTSPYVMQYNLTLQRELPGSFIASVGYVGSSGVHLFSIRDQNLPRTTPGGTGPPGTPSNPFSGTATNSNFGSLNNVAPSSHSTYHSLQANLNRQFSQGFILGTAYTWSKCIDNGSVSSGLEQGSFPISYELNQGYDRGRCSFDINQTFRANAVYSLPFRGNKFVEGWQLSGILSAYGGLPINVQTGFTFPSRSRLGGIVGDRPNYSGAAGCNPDRVLGDPNRWFDPTCYVLQPPGTLGNVGRHSITGPGFFNLDFAMMKNTKVSEKLDVQFRAEFFNATNHPNFRAPTGPPGATLFTGTAAAPIPNPNVGRILSTVNSSRQIQFGLKFIF